MIVAFSGGKDSTAMALRLHELGKPFKLLHTATGNELPPVRKHIDRIVEYTGAELINLKAPTLAELIEEHNCLPNWRMRWCTIQIKIEPCIKFLKHGERKILAVGLRADETSRVGLYGDFADYAYPLRDEGWKINDVIDYCKLRGFSPPARTDCAVCFYQTLYEWYRLWVDWPEYYQQGVDWETDIGHTFRSPQRDTQPADLLSLRDKFKNGYTPKKRRHRKSECKICRN